MLQRHEENPPLLTGTDQPEAPLTVRSFINDLSWDGHWIVHGFLGLLRLDFVPGDMLRIREIPANEL